MIRPGEKHGSFEDGELSGIGQLADGTVDGGVPLAELQDLLARQRAEHEAQTYAIEQSENGYTDLRPDNLSDLDDVEELFEDDEDGEAEDAFSEADHPRGQPDNAGQFASSPGGGSSSGKGEATSKSGKTTSEPVKTSSAYAPGVKVSGLSKADALKAEWSKSAPDTVEKLVASAPAAQQQLAAACDEIGAAVGAKFVNPGAKKPDRIKAKIERGKPPPRITDAARGGFDVESPDQADAIVKALGEHFEVADEGWQKTPAGYFDRKVMVRFEDGLVGEVQFWPPGMLETKEKKGHALYEAWQRAMPGPEKAKLLGAQVALYSMIASALLQAWHSVNFAPAT